MVVQRSLIAGVLSSDTHSNENAPYGCYFVEPAPPLLTGPRRALFRIPSNDRLTFAFGGGAILPRAIQVFPGTKIWEVEVEVKDSGTSNLGDLSVLNNGQSLGSVPVSFDACTRFNTKTTVEEDLWLTLNADGGLQTVSVDGSAGWNCINTDGTSSSAIP